MNKWKILSLSLLTVILFLLGIEFYQFREIRIFKMNYTNTDKQIFDLSKVLENSNLSKQQIQTILKHNKYYNYMDFTKDTIALMRTQFIFKDEKLVAVKNQW